MKYQSRLSRIFFPERCYKCGKIIPISYESCPRCEESITFVGEDFCSHCGYQKQRCLCDNNINIPLPHIAAVYMYSGDIREKIHAMKFHGRISFVKSFSDDLAKRTLQAYPGIAFDGVCFVPMAKEDQRHRGYNQSELLAKSLAHKLGVPLNACLVKTKTTKKQHTLTAHERTENLKNSFSVGTTAEVEGKTLLLCDDIKTTGATLSECVNALISGGAKDVYCICIAMADYKGSNQ